MSLFLKFKNQIVLNFEIHVFLKIIDFQNILKFKACFLQDFYRNLTIFPTIQPSVPKHFLNTNSFASRLPINIYKQEILTAINSNRIVFIGGENGTGKTSQVKFTILFFSIKLFRI